MKVDRLKNIAYAYAKEFYESNDMTLNFDEDLTNVEWYIVTQLAQIYYNVLKKYITKNEAVDQQRKVFDYVRSNQKIFA